MTDSTAQNPQPIPDYVFSADDDDRGMSPAQPAATVIVMRETVVGPPEMLMVKRAAGMAFAANMAVFPGGRVDPEDHALAAAHAQRSGIDVADAAARIAAIRETFEEAGIAIALSHGLGETDLAEWREALLAGESFAKRIAAIGATLQLDQLVPFARWRPNFGHARTFDTRFYLARLPADAPAASLSGGENVDLYWISAADALAAADAKQIDVIFPTRRNLERLACFASFEAAVDSARTFGSPRITPFIQQDGDHQFLCIREDCGYPVTREKLDKAMRG